MGVPLCPRLLLTGHLPDRRVYRPRSAAGNGALAGLDQLHNGDHQHRKAQGHRVLQEADMLEAEGVGDAGEVDDSGDALSQSIIAPQRILLWLWREKTLLRWERMLKLWKISAMFMVRKAMVTPSALWVISHTPLSRKWPTK